MTTSDSTCASAFERLTVIETAVGIAGPLTTRILADAGAQVIKIESRGRLDFNRTRLPPKGMTQEEVADLIPQVHEMNAGKRSITLNLKAEAGRGIFLNLLDRADVYVENFAPGWLERLGMSHAEILERNPRVVILSQSAYGGEGPGRDLRAYASIMTALAGIESVIGYDDGRIVPQISTAVGDLVAGFGGALLVFAALCERERTGRGAIIDLSQIEASSLLSGIAMVEEQLTGTPSLPRGNSHPDRSPHGIYPAAGDDAWVAIDAGEDEEWQRLCATVGISAGIADAFPTRTDRCADQTVIDSIVAEATASHARDDLVALLQAQGIACTPVLSVYEADVSPSFHERTLWHALQHPRVDETLSVTGIPWRLESPKLRPRAAAELLGMSTEAILRDLLNADEAEIARWRDAGALT